MSHFVTVALIILGLYGICSIIVLIQLLMAWMFGIRINRIEIGQGAVIARVGLLNIGLIPINGTVDYDSDKYAISKAHSMASINIIVYVIIVFTGMAFFGTTYVAGKVVNFIYSAYTLRTPEVLGDIKSMSFHAIALCLLVHYSLLLCIIIAPLRNSPVYTLGMSIVNKRDCIDYQNISWAYLILSWTIIVSVLLSHAYLVLGL